MLFKIWEALINLGEPIILFFILHKKLGVRSKCMPLAILGIPVMAAVTVYLNFKEVENLPTILIGFTEYLLYSFSLFKGKAGYKILWSCIMILIIITNNTLLSVPVWAIAASKITSEPGLLRIILTSFYTLLNAILAWLAVHIDEKKRDLPLYIVLTAVAFCVLACISLYFTIDNASLLIDNHLSVVKTTIVAVIIVVLIAALIWLLDAISRALKKVEKANLEIATMNAENTHNEQMLSMINTFREIKHDYVAHILTIASYAKDNDIESINTYLKDFNSEYGVGEAFVATGNRVFDSIMTAKTLLCQKAGIEIKTASIAPKETPFSDLEFASILNNLLDNAIEAQANVVGNKYISVDFNMKGEMVCINVKNSSNGEYCLQNGKLKTSKPDAKLHGIGLKRVETIVKSHRGTITISPLSNTFEVYIVVPMK